MINGTIVTAPDNLKGFDANRRITPQLATVLRAAGYRFAARYIRRTDKHDYDVTSQEVIDILAAKLGLIIVQHVAPEGWMPSMRRAIETNTPVWLPSASKGTIYGQTAVQEVEALGLPQGTMVFCDLEGVDPHAPSSVVITYCNNWYREVADAGFLPGVYVGWSCGLSNKQLYKNLNFSHYWAAYNVDRTPEIRGYQLRQRAAHREDLVIGFTNEDFDVDTTHADLLGGHVSLLVAPGWTP